MGTKRYNDGLTDQQRYRLRHPDRLREISGRYYENHREQRQAESREYRAKHGGRVYASNARRRYGVTPEQHAAMVAAQNAKCAICGVDFAELTRRPCIDHDHATGAVRALLCLTCNTRVGVVETEAAWRDGILSYLEKHKKAG